MEKGEMLLSERGGGGGLEVIKRVDTAYAHV